MPPHPPGPTTGDMALPTAAGATQEAKSTGFQQSTGSSRSTGFTTSTAFPEFGHTAPRERAPWPLRAFVTFALMTALAGDLWRDSIGYPAAFALDGVAALVSLGWLIARRPAWPFSKQPKALWLWMLWCLATLIWSHYTGATALGVLAQVAATVAALVPALLLSWHEVIRVLAAALRWIIGLSILFELVVALVIRHPLLPLVAPPGQSYSAFHPYGTHPASYYWSRDTLLHGGPIQGIMGNSDLLAMCALLACIVFALRWATAPQRFGEAAWLLLAFIELVLARSATVYVALAGVVLVAVYSLWMRRVPQANRWPAYGVGGLAVVVIVTGVLTFWGHFTSMLGKSSDLTGRFTIWHAVGHLATEHPALGWGWVGYWPPWTAPFKGLARLGGVEYLQAHDAWLDSWFQTGAIGVAILVLLALTVLGRAWFIAIDRPVNLSSTPPGAPAPFAALSLLPLLIVAALLLQSITESRLLIEGNWVLFALLAVKTKEVRA